MPKELGKARRADLTGHLPGEQAEYGSAFARFMEGAGQLSPLQNGTYLDHSPNGSNGSHTEIPGMQTESPGRGTDTEIEPAPHAGGNGQPQELSASDTVFDSPLMQEEMQQELSPEPMLTPEPAGDTPALDPGDEPRMLEPGEQPGDKKSEGLLEPVEWEPSADTLHPDAPALDSMPDLTSPENDDSDDDEDDDIAEETDKLPPRGGALPTVKPEPHEISHRNVTIEPATSADTGVLEPAQLPPTVERIDMDELGIDDEEETGISIEAESDADEKITSKVEPRSDVDPRSPESGVRDTVNFYNQTQSLHEQRQRSQGFPTVSPSAVNESGPLDLTPEATAPLPRPEPESPDTGFLDSDDLDDTDLLEPDTLKPEAPALEAVGDIDEADRRDTDKFNEQDRHPDRLPRPEGTDKVDAGGHSGELEPVADEKVAAGKDTQRFYVAEILNDKPAQTGETSGELEPAEEGPPLLAASTGDTASGESTHGATARGDTRREPQPEPEMLPEPADVDTDFLHRTEESPAERIIPEYASLDPEDDDSDDTVDEAAEASSARAERVTAKVRKPAPEPEKESDKVVDWQAGSAEEIETPGPRAPTAADEEEHEAAAARAAGKQDTEPDLAPAARPTPALPRPGVTVARGSHSQRLREEREETLRLIEQAEGVVVKLREASERSRADLVAISSRRASVGDNGHDDIAPPTPEPPPTAPDEASFESPDEFATEIISGPGAETHRPARETGAAEVSSARVRDRVPTRAIGEIIDEIDRMSAEKGPASLSALLDAVSQRGPAAKAEDRDRRTVEEDRADRPRVRDDDPDADLDYLAAASARMRETLARDLDEGDRMPVTARYDAAEEREYSRMSEPSVDAHSPLSADLDRLWQVLDSRRTPTVVLPGGEEHRMPPREDDPLDGWTQEALWRMLIGIAAVTFLLGMLLVFIVFQIVS